MDRSEMTRALECARNRVHLGRDDYFWGYKVPKGDMENLESNFEQLWEELNRAHAEIERLKGSVDYMTKLYTRAVHEKTLLEIKMEEQK